MNCFTLLSGLFGVIFLGAMPIMAQDTVNDERQAQLEDMCRQPNEEKVRPPTQKGLYLGGMLFAPADIMEADVDVDQYTDDPIIILRFSAEAGQRFGQLTAQELGQIMPMFLDGKLLSCPVVNEAILGGELQISGGFSASDAEALASIIRQYTAQGDTHSNFNDRKKRDCPFFSTYPPIEKGDSPLFQWVSCRFGG